MQYHLIIDYRYITCKVKIIKEKVPKSGKDRTYIVALINMYWASITQIILIKIIIMQL